MMATEPASKRTRLALAAALVLLLILAALAELLPLVPAAPPPPEHGKRAAWLCGPARAVMHRSLCTDFAELPGPPTAACCKDGPSRAMAVA